MDRTPQQFRFPFALWTLPLIAQLIEQRFGVVLHKTTVARLLARLGLSPQRPVRRAFTRDDEDVALDPDENLPWPEPALVENWWHAHRGKFKPGTRHLLGKPLTPDSLQDIIRDGRQRQRAVAALELAMAKPGAPLFEVRAPGFRQQKILRPGR